MGKQTILVVDDEDDVRDLVVDILQDEGYHVLAARSGSEALALLAESAVDLLFTDLVMPGVDGLTLARSARGVRPDLKVLFTSGYMSGVALLPSSLDGGKLVRKPWSRAVLCQEIAAALY
jgi:CheY-like chemotaxis protein